MEIRRDDLSDNRPELTPNAKRLLEDRYLRRNDNREIIETPHGMYTRIAHWVSNAELQYGGEEAKDKYFWQFLDSLLNLEIIPSSPYMFNCGVPGAGLFACFVIPIGDSIDDIYKCVWDCAKVYQAAGGIGVDLSPIREDGAIVRRSKGYATGPLSFLEVMNSSAMAVNHGGHRRAASLAALDVDHFDIESFITAKSKNLPEIASLRNIILCSNDKVLVNFAKNELDKLQQYTLFNVSVKATDDFMRAVEEGESINAYSRINSKDIVEKDARELFNLIVKHAWRSAEPGLIFIDNVNKDNPLPGLGRMECCNPCVSKGTLVNTPYGYVPVEKIKEGDDICTVLGREPVKSIEIHKDYPVYKVTFSDGVSQRVTAAHQYHVIKKQGKCFTKQVSKIPLTEAKIGDAVIVMDSELDNIEEIPSEYECGLKAGILLGDGCYTEKVLKKSIIKIATSKDDVKYNKNVKRLFGNKNFRKDDVDKNSKSINMIMRKDAVNLGSLGLSASYSYEKKIDYMVIDNLSFAVGLLDGLLATDGNVNLRSNHPQIRWDTTSYELAKTIRNVLLYCGAHGFISKSNCKGGNIDGRQIDRKHTKYTVTISGGSIKSFGRLSKLYQIHPEKGEKLLKCFTEFKLSGNRWCVTIESIEQDGTEDVYDLYCEKSDTWITEGYVQRGCGEQYLHDYQACNLVTINLNKVMNGGNIDWEKLERIARTATRFSDDAIDVSGYPIPEIEEAVKGSRRLGVGMMGLADILIKKGIPYDSEDARKIASALMEHIRKTCLDESKILAKERGVFPYYEYSIWSERGIKVRNSAFTSVQPNGSTSIIANASASCEPLFNVYYIRRTGDGKQFIELHEQFRKDIEESGLDIEEIVKKLESTGSIQHIQEIPQKIKDIYKCAHDVSPLDHVKMQAALQENCDGGISKCIAKGTRIITSKGLLKIEDIGEAEEKRFGKIFLDDLYVMNRYGKWNRVKSFYNNGKDKTKIFRFDNGAEIETSLEHKFWTSNGWKAAKDIQKSDRIGVFLDTYNNSKGSIILPKVQINNKYKTRYNKFSCPTKMNIHLAELLGCLCADGHLDVESGEISVSFHKKESIAIERCKFLFDKVFNMTAKESIDSRNDTVLSIKYTSRPLCKWIKSLIGYRCDNKHVPEQIMLGSSKEQMAFMKGVTLDGYKINPSKSKAGSYTVIYDGKSKILAKNIFSICSCLGMNPYLGKKYVKEHGYYVYGVRVRGMTGCLESRKDSENNLRQWIKDDVLVARNKALDRKGIEYDQSIKYIRVVDIQNEENNLYDIEVEDSHEYLIDGVISHNTTNLPANATEKDVAELYMTAWKLGCKGITIYREGCRNSVLSTKSASIEEHEKQLVEFLRSKYTVEEWSTKEIADALGVSQTTIFARLKKYGIKRRDIKEIRKARRKKLGRPIRAIIYGNLLGTSRITNVHGQGSFRLITRHYEYASYIRELFVGQGIKCTDVMEIYTDQLYYYFDTEFLNELADIAEHFFRNDVRRVPEELEIKPDIVRHYYLSEGTRTERGGIRLDKCSKKLRRMLEEAVGIKITQKSDHAYVPKKHTDDFFHYIENRELLELREGDIVCPECGGPLEFKEKCKTCPSCGWGACSI